ncbi:MAG: Dabb family protein [Muribaculaceae bacterium]|nr:Dabb family protein [Muribaculaceae bacterium]
MNLKLRYFKSYFLHRVALTHDINARRKVIGGFGNLKTLDVINLTVSGRYTKHPAHVAGASIIAPVKDARACVDYEF